MADILGVAEPKSIVSGGVAAGGKWSLRIPMLGQLVFSAIVKGGCWLRVDGKREAVRLEAGDVGLLRGREGFVLFSDARMKPVEVEVSESWAEITTIGDGSGCTWLAGRVVLHPSGGDLLMRALPELVHVRADAPGAASLRWIVNELVEEHCSTRAGASFATAQLAQLFFVKILRAHLASADAMPRGWLRAARDDRVSRALRLIHDEPGRSPSLDELARAAGMSRTRFAVRFKNLAGVAPLAYLVEWRMQLAQRALRTGDSSIAELARSLGYASDSAFSTAFKRVTGVAPRDYRAAVRGT